jgi:glutamate carboxypeptidase
MTAATAEMIDALRRLVEAESFSTDAEGLARCASVIDELCREVLGSGAESAGEGHLRWRREGDRPVLLLCHYDTVWPPGTLEGWPFTVEDGVARGPGAFDMKAGIVQAMHAAAAVQGPVTILFTGDEEVGSRTSRALIEQEARVSRAVLVLEPAAGESVKVARKGVGGWKVTVEGRAAHAGLEPGRGVNAIAEISRQVERILALARPDVGTTVVVGTIGGGTAANVVPESAWCSVDARMWSEDEAERIAAAMDSLEPTIPGARIRVRGGLNRGPLPRQTSEPLYRRLLALGYEVGAAEVGGGSDGNFTAALGVPTLDGLGPVGGGAHARDEHVLVDEMPRRAEMVARLVADLLADG